MAEVPLIRAYLALGAGLGLQVLVASTGGELPDAVGSGLGLLSGGLLVYGTAVVAEKKGYSAWVGLAGVLSILGVGVVLLLPRSVAFPRPWKRLRTPTRGADAGSGARPGDATKGQESRP
jgi:hypothetical protein